MQYISIMSLLFAFYIQTHALDYLFDHTATHQLHEIETENFRIIFSDNSIEQAKYIVSIAEKEFTHFTKYYGPFHSKKKIRVVISSDYKSANGLASIFLFPVIHLYVSVPPRISDPHSNMGKEYLETLFRHELAHVIQLSFRKIFKKAKILDAINEMIHPAKVFSSRSFVEGAAVFVESQGKYAVKWLLYVH